MEESPPRLAKVLETMSGSGGPCSPAVGSWRNIWGKWQEQHTLCFNLLPSPCARLGHGWRDGPLSAALMLVDGASSPAPQSCFWGKLKFLTPCSEFIWEGCLHPSAPLQAGGERWGLERWYTAELTAVTCAHQLPLPIDYSSILIEMSHGDVHMWPTNPPLAAGYPEVWKTLLIGAGGHVLGVSVQGLHVV